MPTWPKQPVIYEINAWVWLTDPTRRYGRSIGLASIPAAEWDALTNFGPAMPSDPQAKPEPERNNRPPFQPQPGSSGYANSWTDRVDVL